MEQNIDYEHPSTEGGRGIKILMLLDRFFPPDIRVEKEARTLLKAGHDVFLLSKGKDELPDEELVEEYGIFFGFKHLLFILFGKEL
jgi:hypothetical protein